MALDSYSALKASIADFLNRTDLTGQIVDFITLCEARLRRVVRTRHTSILEATLASGDTSIALPADIVQVLSVAFSGATLGSAVIIIPHNVLLEQRRVYTTAAVPRFCSVVGDALEFAPTPDADYTVDIEVEGPFNALSATVASNWILADYPDVYLYGSLAEAAPFLKDDERIPMWNGRFEQALDELSKARDRWKFPAPLTVALPGNFLDVAPR